MPPARRLFAASRYAPRSAKDPAADSKQTADTPATAKGPAGADTPKTPAGSSEAAAPGADSDAKSKGDARKEAKGPDSSADEFASATVKDAITAEAAVASSTTTPAKTTQDQAEASVEKAAQDFSKDAQDEAGRGRLSTALTGKTGDQLSDVQKQRVDSFLDGVGKDGVQGVDTRVAATAPPEGDSQQTPDNALPEGVDGAVTRNAQGTDQVLISKGLDAQSRERTAKEEVGEVIARRAADAGITVAPGDAGARLARAQNGETVSQDSDPAAFEVKGGDTTTVSVDGKTQDASARRLSNHARSIYSQGSNAIWNKAPQVVTDSIKSANNDLKDLRIIANELASTAFDVPNGSVDSIIRSLGNQSDSVFKKSVNLINQYARVKASLSNVDNKIREEYSGRQGFRREAAQAVKKLLYDFGFNNGKPSTEQVKSPTKAKLLSSADSQIAKAIKGAGDRIDRERGQLDDAFKKEDADKIAKSFNTAIGILGLAGVAAGGVGATTAAAKASSVIAGAVGAGLVGANEFDSEELFSKVAEGTYRGSDSTRRLTQDLQKTKTGRAVMELVKKDYQTRIDLLTKDPQRFGDVVATRKMSQGYSTSVNNDFVKTAISRLSAMDKEFGRGSTYRYDIERNNTYGSARFTFWIANPLLSSRTDAVRAAETKKMADFFHFFTDNAKKTWRDEPNFPAGGGGSDRRIKTDIVVVGRIERLGIDLYAWRYRNDDPTRYVGVMAQDLLARPDLAHAVFTIPDGAFAGFYAVDYAALGLSMTTEEAWRGKDASSIAA